MEKMSLDEIKEIIKKSGIQKTKFDVGEDGKFIITGLEPGRYIIEVRSEGSEPLYKVIEIGSGTPSIKASIVQGDIKDNELNTSVPNAKVVVVPKDLDVIGIDEQELLENALTVTESDTEGNFDFLIDEGEYKVVILDELYAIQSQEISVKIENQITKIDVEVIQLPEVPITKPKYHSSIFEYPYFIHIELSECENADYYEIYTNESEYDKLTNLNSEKKLNLEKDTEYRIKYRACNEGGCTSFSPELIIPANFYKPDNPKEPPLVEFSPSNVKIRVFDTVRTEKYEVIVNEQSYYLSEGEIYANCDYKPKIVYTIRYRNGNSYGWSNFSPELKIKSPCFKPTHLNKIKFVLLGSTYVTVYFMKVQLATEYKLYRNGELYKLLKDVGGIVIDDLIPDEIYTFKYMAGNECGWTDFSEELIVKPIETAPKNPTEAPDVKTHIYQENSFLVTVPRHASVSRYQLFINENYHSEFFIDNQEIIKELIPRKYRIAYKFGNENGWSELSPETIAYIPQTNAELPADYELVDYNIVKISWVPIFEATEYQLQFNDQIKDSIKINEATTVIDDFSINNTVKYRGKVNDKWSDWSPELIIPTIPESPLEPPTIISQEFDHDKNMIKITFSGKKCARTNIYEFHINKKIIESKEFYNIICHLYPELEFTVKYRTVNEFGKSWFSPIANAKSYPNLPNNPTSAPRIMEFELGNQGIFYCILRVNKYEGATAYEIYKDDIKLEGDDGLEQQCWLEDLDKEYKIRYKVCNKAGCSDFSPDLLITPRKFLPDTPLILIENTTTYILVRSEKPIVGKYELFKNGEFFDESYANSSTRFLEWEFDDLEPETELVLKYRVLIDNLYTPFSPELIVKTLSMTPSLPVCLEKTQTSAKIRFEKCNAKKYEIYKNEILEYELVDNKQDIIIKFDQLEPDKKYSFKYRGFANKYFSLFSPILIIQTPPIEILKPETPLKAPVISNIKTSTVEISWERIPKATEYQLYKNDQFFKKFTTLTAVISGLIPGEEYWFSYTAGNEHGWSDSSPNSIRIKTKLLPPRKPSKAPTYTFIRDFSVKVNWEPIAKATEYQLYKNRQSIGKFKTSSVQLRNLKPSTIYKFKYKAGNQYGWSDYSPESSVKTKAKEIKRTKPKRKPSPSRDLTKTRKKE